MRRISKDTRRFVVDQTEMQQRRRDKALATAHMIIHDEERDTRISKGLCIGCHYLPFARLSGQAFTAWQCIQCAKPQPHHPNTSVPKLCHDCGTKYNLCVICLADLDLKLDDDRNHPLVKAKKETT